MNDPCLSFEVLSRSHSENEEPAHLGHCERCRRTFAALARLDDLARSIPHEAPDPLHTLHMEQALVALAAPPRRRSLAALFPAPRARWAIGAAVAVSAAIALVAVLPAPRAPLRQLEASPGARYDHARRAMDGGTIDWMSLSQGTISLHVEHLGQGERFVVATTDAEVEVRGTRFEVDAREGKLRRVQVQEGMVEVRAAGRAPVALRPGERWLPDDGSSEASATIAAGREGVGASPGDGLPAPVDAPDAPGIPFPLPGTERENAAPGALSRLPGGALAAPGASASLPGASREMKPGTPLPLPGRSSGAVERRSTKEASRQTIAAASPGAAPPATAAPDAPPAAEMSERIRQQEPEPHPASASESAFAMGWAALRDGDPHAAADLLGAATEAEGELGANAAYWEIVALSRAGSAASAEARMRRFLEVNVGSDREGEVSLMLGLQLAARGDRPAAEPLLRRAASDPQPRIRSAAERALARLATMP